MKKTIGLVALVLGLYSTAYTQENLFQRTIGGNKVENSYGVERTLDGGYISVGYTESYGKGKKDIYLVKTDGLGNVEWSKAYGEGGDDIGWNIAIASDSGFVVVGTTNSYKSEGDAIVMKVDKSGTFLWARTIASDSIEDGYNVIKSLYSTGYYITGFVKTDSSGTDGFIAKLGSTGIVRWYKTFGSPGNEEAYGLSEDARGNVIITGLTTYDSITNGGLSGSSGSSDAFICKFDSTGGFKWMKTYGSDKDDAGWDVKVDKNKYIVSGWSNSFSITDNDILLITCDTSGGSVSALTYGTAGDDRGFDIIIKPNSAGFAVVGYAQPFNADRDVVFSDFSNAGVIGNSMVYGESDRDGHWPTGIAATNDGGYVILSTSNSFNSSGNDDLFLTKIRNDGTSLCNSSTESLNSFPLSVKSTSFGNIATGYATQTPTVSTTTISSQSDSTLCCQISAALPKTSVSVCQGLSVSLGNTPIRGLKYSWKDATGKQISTLANPSVSPSSSTTYKLVVSSNDKACNNDSVVVNVTVNKFLTEDLARDTSFCQGDSAQIVGSSNMISYLWVGRHINSNTRINSVKLHDTIYFTGLDRNSCKYLDTMIVTVHENPIFNLGKDTTICEISPIVLSGPANMQSYDWNNGEAKTQTFKTAVEKTHKLRVVDANNCTASDEIKILINPSSPFSLGADDSFCLGASYTILGPGALSGYIWNDTASGLQNLSVKAAGSYRLTAYNSFGCPSSDTINLVLRGQPSFSLGADFALCVGKSRYLVGPTDMTTYLWNNSTTDDSLRITTSGDYWLKVTDKYTCTYADSIKISIGSNPIISLGIDTTILLGDSLALSPGSGFTTYSWSTGQSTPTIYVKNKGTYSVTVTDQNGCEGFASITIDTTSVGIRDLQLVGLRFFPNPASKAVTLEFGSLSSDQLTTKIVDLTGKVFESTVTEIYPGNNSLQIDVSKFTAGNYIIWLSNSKGSTALKIAVE